MILHAEPIRVWCQTCREHVTLMNLKPWPEGVLAVGECPRCQSKLAASQPLEWRNEAVRKQLKGA